LLPKGSTMRQKHTSRLIVVDEDNRVLLFRVVDKTVADPRFPAQGSERSFWITPGGSLEPGESHEDAARRELWEETGIDSVDIGPWVWTDQRQLSWSGEPVQLYERYYLIRVNQTQIRFQQLSAQERKSFKEHKWWTVANIPSSRETIFPLGFGDLVLDLTEGRIPSTPIWLSEQRRL
jgi:8-oxo-dGTP diphosphatase